MLVPKSVHEKHNLSDNCMILCCRSTGLKMVSRSLRGASTTGSAEILMEPAPCTLLQPHWTMTATTPSWQATLRWVEKTMQTPMFDCLSDMSPLVKIMFSGLNGKRGLNETGKPWRGSKVYVEQALELSFPALTLTFHFLLSVRLAVPGVLSPHKLPLFLSQGRVSCTGRMMVQAVNQRGRSQRSAPGHMRRWGWQQRERRQTKSPSGACGAGCSPSARASVLAHTFPHGFKTVQEASI